MTPLLLLNFALIKIVLVGDSTVNDDGGWGPGFRASLNPDVAVVNLARNGRSSKSFRAEGVWDKALAEKPQYILIQFGHNDQPGKGPDRETDAATTYRDNMARYVDEARAIGATPVLVTSIVRRNFDALGKIKRDPLFSYAESVRSVAAEKHVPLIDLYALTLAQTERLGPAGSESFNAKQDDGKPDTTHLAIRGQKEIGVMAAQEFARLVPDMKAHLHDLILWRDALRQPDAFYGSAEAMRVADNLLVYQHDIGGWDKNIDMAMPLGTRDRPVVEREKSTGLTTLDNDATWTQIRYLARVHLATPDARYAGSVGRGLNYVLAAQYANGGWPQFYPLRDGYWDHITYNDDAMIGVMETLRDISAPKPEYAFIPAADRARATVAIAKGLEVILKTQIVQNGKLTAWCAQHDERTLAPVQARSYELASVSGSESVGIVEYLMSLDRPTPEVIRAVQGAVAWFSASKIRGVRIEGRPDRHVVLDPAAPLQWARFYELGTNRPIFIGRDGVVKYAMSEIEAERRNGYRWYVDRPAKMLDETYPAWIAKWSLPDAR